MTTIQDRTGQAAQILQRSVCLTFERHYLGNNRRVDPDDLKSTVDVDKSALSVRKILIDPKELTPVNRIQSQARSYLQSVALPAHKVFGERSYLVPLALVETVHNKLTEFQAELKVEAAKLAARYAAAVQRQREVLGPLFSIGDYSTPEEVMDAFSIDWSFVSFAAPEKLETVSMALAKAAEEKHQQRLANAYDEVLLSLRTAALAIVKDLVEKLTPGDDGKPKIIRGTALDALIEFAELLPKRNLTDDDKLAAAVQRLANRAKGVNVDDLKAGGSEAVRQGLQEAAKQAQGVLAGLVQQGHRRAIKLPGHAA